MNDAKQTAKKLLKEIGGMRVGLLHEAGREPQLISTGDIIDVCNAYLAEHTADDAQPADETAVAELVETAKYIRYVLAERKNFNHLERKAIADIDAALAKFPPKA